MRTKNEKLHETRKRQILDAAAHCFAAKGLMQTTMQDICAAVGLSPGTVYRYYASKDAIITAFAESHAADTADLTDHLAQAETIIDGFHAVIPPLMAEMCNKDTAQVVLEIGVKAGRDPDIGQAFQAADTRFATALADLLRADQAKGHVDPDLDVEAAVQMILLILDGLLTRYAFPVPISRERLAAMVIRILAKTLVP